MLKKTIIILAAAAVLASVSETPALAQLFKWTSDYKNLHNEKVAVELELKGVQRQFSNEKSNLESTIKDLERQIERLDAEIESCNKRREKDNSLCEDRVKELQGTIDTLQRKGSDREKDLVEESKKMQARYEGELAKLRKELQDERTRRINELDETRKSYESRMAEMRNTIANLNNEMGNLKKLTKAQQDELDRMKMQADELEKQLGDEIRKGEIRLKRFHDKLVINIDDRISFDSGSAELKIGILPALQKITKILSDYPEYNIVVEGHTDNVPIKTRQFRDNWQLSTERGLAVLNYILNHDKKINNARFSAAGYGEFNPIVSNDTAANRALNRRVDIVVIPRAAKK
ncbi:MAG TPA: OmpA family protein [Spirochaetota bacterium]|nr:OmpA family protein [Spirochaetota bacterium]